MTTHRKDSDRQVAAAYRELAQESSPRELDERILAMARKSARTPYGLARIWIRPVAWAATIGLSLAIVLELSRVDDPAPPAQGAPAAIESQAEAAPERESTDAAAVMKIKEERSSYHGAASRRDALEPEPESSAATEDGTPVPGPEAKTTVMPATLTRARSQEDAARTALCDADARRDADAWYACIARLREQGKLEAAAEELAALRRAFPEFREPHTE